MSYADPRAAAIEYGPQTPEEMPTSDHVAHEHDDGDAREHEPTERRAERLRLRTLPLPVLADQYGLGEHDDATVLLLVLDPARGAARVHARAVEWALTCWDGQREDDRRATEQAARRERGRALLRGEVDPESAVSRAAA